MRRRVLRLALVASVAAPLLAQAAVGLAPSGEVDASRLAGAQHSPALAADPADARRLVLVATAPVGLFAARSADGGATWTPVDPTDGTIADGTAEDGLVAACCDPTLAWDARGNLFLAYRSAGSATIEVALSLDGGVSFAPLASFAGSSIGRPALATGAHVGGAPGTGTVWVAYAAGNVVVGRGAYVAGTGAVGSFTAAQAASGSTGGGVPALAVGAAGDVVLAYQQPATGEGPADIRVHRDANGLLGGGFDAGAVVGSTGVGGADLVPAQPTAGITASPTLVWDPPRGRLYLAYVTETPDESDDTDVVVRASLDGGLDWGPAVRANDDAPGPTQLLPRLALERDTGALAVGWLDARDDAANATVRLYAAVTVDGGASFSPAAGVSIGAAAPVPPADHGTQLALVAGARVFVAAWTTATNALGNNPDGTAAPDIHVARLALEADCLTDAECDDAEPCNGLEVCAGTACLPGTPAPDGTPCDDGDACTLVDACASGGCSGGAPLACAPCFSCDPAVGCVEALLGGCRTPTAAKRSSLALATRRGGRLGWRWQGGATAAGDLGDPTATTGYELCVYDARAGTPRLALAEVIPPGGVCNGRPCWRATRRGFRFRDRDRTPEGLARLDLDARPGGRTAIVAQGHGGALRVPALPLALEPRVTVQLRSTAGACWESSHSRPARNDESRFRARADAAGALPR